MVGITQGARSIQDEKLVEAIFSSHSQHSPSRPPSSYDQATSQVYGAQATNIIIDARPTKNAYANSVKGAGTENMSFYRNCKKEYLGIDNIHVMRSSLNGIFEGEELALSPQSPVLTLREQPSARVKQQATWTGMPCVKPIGSLT